MAHCVNRYFSVHNNDGSKFALTIHLKRCFTFLEMLTPSIMSLFALRKTSTGGAQRTAAMGKLIKKKMQIFAKIWFKFLAVMWQKGSRFTHRAATLKWNARNGPRCNSDLSDKKLFGVEN